MLDLSSTTSILPQIEPETEMSRVNTVPSEDRDIFTYELAAQYPVMVSATHLKKEDDKLLGPMSRVD